MTDPPELYEMPGRFVSPQATPGLVVLRKPRVSTGQAPSGAIVSSSIQHWRGDGRRQDLAVVDGLPEY
jgi:hypothetical protein